MTPAWLAGGRRRRGVAVALGGCVLLLAAAGAQTATPSKPAGVDPSPARPAATPAEREAGRTASGEKPAGPTTVRTGLQVRPAPAPRPESEARHASQALRNALSQAHLLLRQGEPDAALEILETLHREHPRETRVTIALGRAYEQVDRSAEAIVLYRAAVREYARNDLTLWLELSRAYQQADQGRAAMRTLLDAVRDRPAWGRTLTDRFELLASDSTLGPAALAQLQEAVADSGGPVVWREILGHVYAATGEPQQALTLLMQVEREEASPGRRVMALAKTLQRGARPAPALAAYDSVLALDPPGGTREECWYEKGRLLASLGRHAEAADAYRVVAARFPRGALAPRATLARAELLREQLGQPAEAEAVYRELIARAEAAPRRKDLRLMRDEAQLGLATVALRRGDLDAAGERFAELAEHAAREEIREQAAFEVGELHFYRGDFPAAEAAFYALTDAHRSGGWVNDALERILLIGEHGAASAALRHYAASAYERRMGAFDSALAKCRAGLAAAGEEPVQAPLRFQEVQLLVALERWAEADSSLFALRAAQPAARETPEALLYAAERALDLPARRAQTRDYLETLVLDYPESFAARRARQLLRALPCEGEPS